MSARARAGVALASIVLGGCGGPSDDPVHAVERPDDPAPTCATFDAYELDVGAHPSALHFDPASRGLYFVDDDTNRILMRSEDGMVSVLSGIDNPSNDPTTDALGEIVVDAEGAAYVARSGYGDSELGAVYRVRPGQPAERIPGLATVARRVGLVWSSAGVLYATTHEKVAGGGFAGHVDRIDVAAGGEVAIATGLSKPTGLAELADGTLLVAEPAAATVYALDPAGTSGLTAVATGITGIDRLAPAGDAVLATAFDPASGAGQVLRVRAGGEPEIVAHGSWQPRGIAFDPSGRVLVSRRDASAILVLPVCLP